MCSSPGPGGVHALQARRSVVAPRGNMQHDVVPAADAQVLAASETFGYQPGPTATDASRTASRRSSPPQSPGPQHAGHRLDAAGHRMQGEGGVGQPVAPAAHHVHADVQRVLCARLRLKNQRRQLGAPRTP